MSIVTAFLLALVPLVVIHELGHFLMAKLGGIHVSEFCIGFGKRLFGFRYKGTEYRWNLLPFGGYVDLMGDMVYEGRIPSDPNHFYNRPKWIRFLVLIMGPMFNLLFALALYWIYHTFEPETEPIYLGDGCTVGAVAPDYPEAKAGLKVGDQIFAINDQPVGSWSELSKEIMLNPNANVTLKVNRGGVETSVSYVVQAEPTEGYGLAGFAADRRIAIGSVREDGPAAKAGLLEGDVVVSVNGTPITLYTDTDFNTVLSKMAPGPSKLVIERNGVEQTLEVTPEYKTPSTEDEAEPKKRWMIGISLVGEHTSRDLTWVEAFPVAWASFLDDSTLLYKALKKLFIGALPLKMLSGPVGMAKAAGDALDLGLFAFLGFLAILSLNLGIMNLLPIPVLDGGEILVLFVEGIARKNFSLDTKLKIKMGGFVFLIALMAFVLVSDIFKLIQ